uniref:ribonuclease H n=1 Tax=Knipowitschia caucasica TaxID=637954 RepID=A0AAV2KT76_KNICA
MGRTPIVQNVQRLQQHDDLFYEIVTLSGRVKVSALLDSGSMACTLSASLVPQLLQEGVINPTFQDTDVVLIGCGGSRTLPVGVCDLNLEMYGCSVVVPTLVVNGQSEDLIIGSNLLRYVISRLKRDFQGQCPSVLSCKSDAEQKLLSLMAGVETEDVSNAIDTSTLPDCPRFKPCPDSSSLQSRLGELGLSDIDVESCQVSTDYKTKLAELIVEYESIFSRNKLDCGKATGYLHRIRVLDEKPFRLPCRRIPPTQYEKLRQALDEMEEREIIRKSSSEFASPLVLVSKKSGDLRICNDFRWLNARTVKDAHPLPHPADALAALGGNAFFSTMDLTSGYYNVEVHEEDKKYTAFSSPFGLYEYNRMPQGLCNSPATFMRMMLSIFGDQNFMSLLCYLDDVLVFASNENLALERLRMVFDRLQSHNLKLAPKKCNFLRRSVKFLGHVIGADGIQSDHDKVAAITSLKESDLMEDGTSVPSQRKVCSFLVEVEDRVLLANKGERGKRKLADRWENTVYVVVEKNDESHTFKIQNPISDPDGDVLSPVSSSVDLSRSAVTEESTKSAEFRTRAWVSGLPSDTGSVTSVEDSVLENAVPLDEPESDAMDSSLPRAPDLETAMAPDFDMTDVPAAASAEAVQG